MMLQQKGSAQAAVQGASKATACATRLVASVHARRRPAAFQSGPRRLVVRAAAEPEQQAAPAAPARAPRAPKAPVTVDLQSVEAGDEFTGTVTKVEQYGAFVNFGAEREGLVHISQLSDGYVASADSVVSAGQEVTVRVLSVDAAAGKIALTMKGFNDEDGEGADAGDDEDDAEEEAAAQLVFGEDTADFAFPFAVEGEEGEEITPEAVAALAEQDAVEIEHATDLDLPLNELITGKVSKVESGGAYILVTYNGQEVEAYLDRDEAKVPSAALSPEELLEFVGEGEPVPEYIDIVGQEILYEDDEDEDSREAVDDMFMFEDMTKYYKEGDEVSAFVLGFDSKRDMMALTHFTDAEVQTDGLEAVTDEILAEEDEDDEDEGEGGRGEGGRFRERSRKREPRMQQEEDDEEDVDEDEVPLSRLGAAAGDDFDPLVFGPDELLGMAEEDDAVDGDDAMGDEEFDGEAAAAIGEYKVYSTGLGFSTSKRNSIRASDVEFPERPSDAVDRFAMQNVVAADTDFDGDEIYLDDIWQENGLEVSEAAWKKLGLKIQFDESGEAEVVEREGGAPAAAAAAAAEAGEAAAEEADAENAGELALADAIDIDDLLAAANGHDARVAEWVALLTEGDDEEEEAEVPTFAMRRPLRS